MLGALAWTGIGMPPWSIIRWNHGHPPLSPYGTHRRAMVVGTSYWRAANRTTASAAILLIE